MTNVAGAICIGQVVVLYMTTRGVSWKKRKMFPLVSFVRCARRVASWCFVHFTYFAYETHADVKPATIRWCWIILRERDRVTAYTTFPTTQRARDYRTKRGDCLLSARAEMVLFARRNAFAFAVCYDAASYNYSFAKTQNSR